MSEHLKVIYVGRDQSKIVAALTAHQNILLLVANSWDDFSYKTTFHTHCQLKSKPVEMGSVQILIENQHTSSSYLDKLIGEGWSGEFPIPETLYISLPSALTFYEQIEGHLGLGSAIDLALTMHDAGYLTKIKEDGNALRLVSTIGFRKSLQREQGAIKAFLDGWKIFDKQTVLIGNQEFLFRSVLNSVEI